MSLMLVPCKLCTWTQVLQCILFLSWFSPDDRVECIHWVSESIIISYQIFRICFHLPVSVAGNPIWNKCRCLLVTVLIAKAAGQHYNFPTEFSYVSSKEKKLKAVLISGRKGNSLHYTIVDKWVISRKIVFRYGNPDFLSESGRVGVNHIKNLLWKQYCAKGCGFRTQPH